MISFRTDHATSFPVTRQAQVICRFPADMIMTQMLIKVFRRCCHTVYVADTIKSVSRLDRCQGEPPQSCQRDSLATFSPPTIISLPIRIPIIAPPPPMQLRIRQTTFP